MMIPFKKLSREGFSSTRNIKNWVDSGKTGGVDHRIPEYQFR